MDRPATLVGTPGPSTVTTARLIADSLPALSRPGRSPAGVLSHAGLATCRDRQRDHRGTPQVRRARSSPSGRSTRLQADDHSDEEGIETKRRTGPAGSALLPLVLLACFSGRVQHTQQALGDFLIQEILPELAQRLIELGVAIVRRGPDHWRGLAILGQRAISRDCRARLILRPFDHKTTDVVKHGGHARRNSLLRSVRGL